MPPDHRLGDTREEVHRRSAPSGDSIASGRGTDLGTGIGDGIWSASRTRASSSGPDSRGQRRRDDHRPEKQLVSTAPTERTFELRLGHPRAAADIAGTCFLVQLIPRAAAGTRAPAPKATAPARGESSLESLDGARASPLRARSLFTVLAAISSAVSSDLPCSSSKSLDVVVLPCSLRPFLYASWRHHDLPRNVTVVLAVPPAPSRKPPRLTRGHLWVFTAQSTTKEGHRVHRWRLARTDHHHPVADLDLLNGSSQRARGLRRGTSRASPACPCLWR